MKKAMLAVNKALPKGAEIILQIHDSLIIECFDQQVEEVKQLLIEKMENVAPELPVKLAVDATTGKDWGEL
jgi:DNA polymerase-1